MKERCSLEFLCGMISFRADILDPLTAVLRGFCFGDSPPHPLQRIDEQDRNKYERYLEPIGDLGNNGGMGEPVEQGFADFVGERRDKNAKHDHLGDHEKKGERIALIKDR